MKTQSSTRFERLRPGQAQHLERLGGEMTVLSGRIWLTRDGAKGDHFLEAGDSVTIGVDEYAVIESAFTGGEATLRWTPRRQSLAGRVLAEPLTVLAMLAQALSGCAGALAAWLAAAAQRAQGRVDAPAAGGAASASAPARHFDR